MPSVSRPTPPTISIDVYEPGPAPEDPLAWVTVNGIALLVQLGVVEPS